MGEFKSLNHALFFQVGKRAPPTQFDIVLKLQQGLFVIGKSLLPTNILVVHGLIFCILLCSSWWNGTASQSNAAHAHALPVIHDSFPAYVDGPVR